MPTMLLFFAEKNVRIFAYSHIFPTKNNSLFVILLFMLKILMNHFLTVSLISTGPCLVGHCVIYGVESWSGVLE